MALREMFPAINSIVPPAIVVQLSATDTTVVLSDASHLPAPPNIVTISTEDHAELVYYQGIEENTLTGCVRGFSGTVAQIWEVGTVVYRAGSAYDHNTFRENILDLDSRLGEDGVGLPPGGVPGQIPVKAGSADGDIVWGDGGYRLTLTTNPSQGVFAGGTPLEVTAGCVAAWKHGDVVKGLDTIQVIQRDDHVRRYGIRWDRANAQCTRLWDAEDIPTDTASFGHFGSANASYSNPFDLFYPWRERKLCNVDLAAYSTIYAAGGDIMGAITAWEDSPGFAYDGSNGAVMVYTPAFWAYMERGADYDTYGVADGELPGWTKIESSIGARYHGSQDGSGGITSVAGATAWRGASIRTMLQAAKNKNMTLDDVWTWCADSLLLCVEYATMNTQTAIGNGCASLYIQGATGSEYKPLVAESNANRVIAPVAMQAMAARPGAVLDIGTSNGGLQVASRIVTSVEDYPDDTGYKIINFSGDPVNVLTTHFLSIHGCGNMADEAIGSASGYIGANGYCNAYYRGRVAFANYWRYVLGAYRQTGTGHIWMAHDRVEAQESETGLDTTKHIDTGLAVPNGAAGAAVSAYLSALHFVDGMPLTPFASDATGGNSTNPVGDYVYTPTLATANTILLAGAYADGGAICGRFYGDWGASASGSSWRIAVAPFLLSNEV